jgi:hypothetical protein
LTFPFSRDYTGLINAEVEASMTILPVRNDRSQTVIRWVARIWSLLLLGLILFASLNTGPEGIYGLPAVEYIPMAAIAIAQIGLLLAFHWEKWGGTVALIGALTIVPAYLLGHGGRLHEGLFAAATLWAIPAVLFLVCWWRTQRGS